jgi:hypothetical protein
MPKLIDAHALFARGDANLGKFFLQRSATESDERKFTAGDHRSRSQNLSCLFDSVDCACDGILAHGQAFFT